MTLNKSTARNRKLNQNTLPLQKKRFLILHHYELSETTTISLVEETSTNSLLPANVPVNSSGHHANKIPNICLREKHIRNCQLPIKL